MADWLAGADPSWFPLVLAVLQRDYPDIADKAWGTAVGENAERQTARQEEPGPFGSGSSGSGNVSVSHEPRESWESPWHDRVRSYLAGA